MVDIDFVCAEYDNKDPKAVIEYTRDGQHHTKDNPNIITLGRLATDAGRPFFVVRYTTTPPEFTIYPRNDLADEKLRHRDSVLCNEKRYVRFLYYLRGRELPMGLKFDGTGTLKAQ
jgi:hypothetical protein